MIGRTLRIALAVLVLGSSLAALPALAKKPCSPLANKTKGCRNEIKGCKFFCFAVDCTGLKGKPKAQCRHNCVVTKCKTPITTACATDNTRCTASASGAFLH